MTTPAPSAEEMQRALMTGIEIRFSKFLPIGALYCHPDTLKGPDPEKMQKAVNDLNALLSPRPGEARGNA